MQSKGQYLSPAAYDLYKERVGFQQETGNTGVFSDFSQVTHTTVFSLLRLFTDVKNKILLVKSDTRCLERCFLRNNLVKVLSQSLQRLLHWMQENRFSFRTGLWDYNELSDVSQGMSYCKEQPGL